MHKKSESRAELVAKFTLDALHLSRDVHHFQQRIVKIAATIDPNLEPTGRLAGVCHA